MLKFSTLNASASVLKGASSIQAVALEPVQFRAAPAASVLETVASPAPAKSIVAKDAVFMMTRSGLANVSPSIAVQVFNPGRFTDTGRTQVPPAPGPPSHPRREELSVPIASVAVPTDADIFESPDGSKRYALPRYALAFDIAGGMEEPRLSIETREGAPTLVVVFEETPSPAASAETNELAHLLSVSLKYRVPVIDGREVISNIAFPSIAVDATRTTVTASIPLTTPGLRQQILAALSSLDASATFVVGRSITVGVPAPNGESGYVLSTFNLDWTVQPAPVVLSDAQRKRLGGGDGGVQPMIRTSIAYQGASYAYWQDSARPEHFYFLPDRFLLARAQEGNRRPLLRVRAAAVSGDEVPRLALEFRAVPVIDLERIAQARGRLEELARQRGVTLPLVLEIIPDPQPLLRLALPENGAPSSALVERPLAEIDLETGVSHVETLTIEDFQLVYTALFGASLTLLHGEVRAMPSGSTAEDVPLELRLDRTVGDVLEVSARGTVGESLEYRLTNVIESPVRLDHLVAAALLADRQIPLRIDGLAASPRLLAGQSVNVLLVPPEPIPASSTIIFDQAGLTVEPDAQAIWTAIFDRSAGAQINRKINIAAVPILFSSTDRPNDRVAAFVVTVEHGGSVRLTETELQGQTTVRIPIEPLITGAPRPPLRYQTETWWASGGLGVSAWRDTDAALLIPLKTAPG